MHLVISCSLNKKSKSRIMADYAYSMYRKNATMLDLLNLEIPFCDGDECYNDPVVKELSELIKSAQSIILASPVYNYGLNAAAKNLVELTGKAWDDKLVGFMCASGGKSSYMSPMSFMDSLMLNFRCIIIPRFVYADRESFDESNNLNNQLKDRIHELVDRSIVLSKKIAL